MATSDALGTPESAYPRLPQPGQATRSGPAAAAAAATLLGRVPWPRAPGRGRTRRPSSRPQSPGPPANAAEGSALYGPQAGRKRQAGPWGSAIFGEGGPGAGARRRGRFRRRKTEPRRATPPPPAPGRGPRPTPPPAGGTHGFALRSLGSRLRLGIEGGVQAGFGRLTERRIPGSQTLCKLMGKTLWSLGLGFLFLQRNGGLNERMPVLTARSGTARSGSALTNHSVWRERGGGVSIHLPGPFNSL